ncbi:hypothetical protein FB45DRAFT_407707 [Roridomyces roridus]|uniref:Golgi apparatus membrane protein TVP38 n=1 Tax=Roridomyces roridus TaxID=1738132 RepID=A0AAD7C4B6_9AGAR|nr:hypothetical protein FB45DRAFT_407707 [Roridomyces roridus]
MHPTRLISLPSPARPVSTDPEHHRPSQSPFRYVHFTSDNEKETPLSPISSSSSTTPSSSSSTIRPPTPTVRPTPPASPVARRSAAHDIPRGLRIASRLRPWIPLLVYGASSLGFGLAILFWKTQVFNFLDNLSTWLRSDAFFGYAVLFVLIFITTFPPIPMYSTLIVLSGYTFGVWPGAVLSYFAALTGALTVFLLSRTLLRNWITRWLDSATTIKRVVRAVEKRPQLLFLVRLAPYPYNVMNCLLAASPTLTLQTYTLCTAASLFKVIIHTSIGASIHSFKDYHTETGKKEGENPVARVWTILGLVLCIAIFVYLSYLARRAVNDELEGDEAEGAHEEETAAFLSDSEPDLEAGNGPQPMVELRRSPTPPPTTR